MLFKDPTSSPLPGAVLDDEVSSSCSQTSYSSSVSVSARFFEQRMESFAQSRLDMLFPTSPFQLLSLDEMQEVSDGIQDDRDRQPTEHLFFSYETPGPTIPSSSDEPTARVSPPKYRSPCRRDASPLPPDVHTRSHSHTFSTGSLLKGSSVTEKNLAPGIQFFEYPSSERFRKRLPTTAVAPQGSVSTGYESDAHLSEITSSSRSGIDKAAARRLAEAGRKLFIGGLRFEVIQMGREAITWIFEVACGVHLQPNGILIHRKGKSGRNHVSPTGCASVFVTGQDDAELLLGMNQRIFCGERGVFVADSAEGMSQQILSGSILDFSEGKVRGPAHPVVIERAGTPAKRQSSSVSSATSALSHIPLPPSYSATAISSSGSAGWSSTASSLCGADGLPAGAVGLPPSYHQHYVSSIVLVPQPVVATGGSDVNAGAPHRKNVGSSVFYDYPGDESAGRVIAISSPITVPSGVFIGGLPAKVGAEYVAWLLYLMGARVHPQQVRLLHATGTACSSGADRQQCAVLQVDEHHLPALLKYQKRVVCIATGVWIGSSPADIMELLVQEQSLAGAFPLVIERRLTTQQLPPVAAPLPPPRHTEISQPPPSYKSTVSCPNGLKPRDEGLCSPSEAPARAPTGVFARSGVPSQPTGSNAGIGITIPPPPPPYGQSPVFAPPPYPSTVGPVIQLIPVVASPSSISSSVNGTPFATAGVQQPHSH